MLTDRVGGPTRARGSPASAPSPTTWGSNSSSSSIKQCSGANVGRGVTSPDEEKCCPIDKSTSENGSRVSHRTQSCRRSERRPRANGSGGIFFPPYLSSPPRALVFRVPPVQDLPLIGMVCGTEGKKKKGDRNIFRRIFGLHP